MPNNDQGSSLMSDIQAGASLMVQEPSGKPEAGGETPVQKVNEEVVAPSVEPVSEETVTEQIEKDESKTFVSGSTKARQLGESRRSLGKALLTIAKEGDYWVKESVKKQIEADSTLQKYYQKAWPKDYQELFGTVEHQETTEEQPSIEEIEKRATIKARAEVLSEQLQIDRREDAYDLASKLAFTQAEADSLLNLAGKIEGEEVAGKKLDFEEALKRAAHMIRPEKAKVGIPSTGQIQHAPTETQLKQTAFDKDIESYAKRWGRNPDEVKKNVQEVESNMKNGVFQLQMH